MLKYNIGEFIFHGHASPLYYVSNPSGGWDIGMLYKTKC